MTHGNQDSEFLFRRHKNNILYKNNIFMDPTQPIDIHVLTVRLSVWIIIIKYLTMGNAKVSLNDLDGLFAFLRFPSLDILTLRIGTSTLNRYLK